jgi:malonate-semialdehyde dehydrogenase (acetylating)/methylmalonate-semialdehyde dehydrogenase
MRYPEVKNYINGQLEVSRNGMLEVICPLDGEIISNVPLSKSNDLDSAVMAAKEAFPDWANTTIKERVQVFYRYKMLMEKNLSDLAVIIRDENGKTMNEAIAEIEKSIEVTEFACSLPQLITGDVLEVSRGVECCEERYPLGVVTSITPFNFPNMVPNWTIPIILANVVHGDKDIVETICDHPDIKAISFVGSTSVAKAVYLRATSNLKRALCLGGAKNHLIVLPDANVAMTASNIAASMTGCAGQRCMAASALVAVGSVEHIIAELCKEAKKIIPGENLGAVISKKARERIENYIAEAEETGAKVLIDGRNAVVEGKENGYYVGPTILDYVQPEMKIAREEVFGPVLAILRAENVDDAIAIENQSQYGNAASVFTQSGGMARYVNERVSAGMIGVNIGVPVPREPFSFGGWNESKFGIGDITGKSSMGFWTKLKKTTTKWNPEAGINWMS